MQEISFEPLKIKSRRLKDIQNILDTALEKYYNVGFIDTDPVSIPHLFSKKQDIEIIGLWTAILSWGNRKSILNSANKLVQLMDGAPYDFIVNHKEHDRKKFMDFKHRTFQPDDALYFLHFLQWYYKKHDSLENAFIDHPTSIDKVEVGLIHFQNLFSSLPEFLPRTKKHISSPKTLSSCKRLNMFLRWMVRKDNRHIDFGLWNKIKMTDLYIPLDVHVFRVAQQLGITSYKSPNWRAVKQITNVLKKIDNNDPVKYDYALFSLGVHAGLS